MPALDAWTSLIATIVYVKEGPRSQRDFSLGGEAIEGGYKICAL